ncbi:MAG: protein kinase [Verrucomicrobiia bacterium]
MAETRNCTNCGAPLVSGALGNRCARCLMSLAISEAASDAADLRENVSETRRFADYELLEEIGRGGMGVVYRARQVSLNRIVAVKMLLSRPFASPELEERLQVEAEAAAGLSHPNIVTIHTFGEHEGQFFFAMEYVEGRNLAQLTRHHSLPPPQAAVYLKTIAEAIHYAHEHGLLHRDLKPSNILVDLHDKIHITDFGLAKRLGTDTELTLTGQLIGSPNYLSPEQAAGQHRKLTARSDVYALGAVLYQLLTGRPPLIGASLQETLLHIREKEVASPRLLSPRVPRDLEIICLKCLQKEPEQRYATAQALADDLGRFLAGEPILARPLSLPARFTRWCRRKPRMAALSGAVLASLLIGIAGIVWQWQRAESQRARAEAEGLAARQNLYAAHMLLAQQALARCDLSRAMELLDRQQPQRGQSKPACPSPELDLRGWEWRYLRASCQSDEQFTLDQQSNAVTAVAFSTDGHWLAVRRRPGTVSLWDLRKTDEPRKVTEQPGGPGPKALAVSPRADLLAWGSPDSTGRSGLSLWHADSLQPVAWLPHSATVVSLSFAPDASALAALAEDGRIRVWETASQRVLRDLWGDRVSADFPDTGSVRFSPDGEMLVAGGQALRIKRWHWRTGSEAPSILLPPSGHHVLSLAFSPDGRWLAMGTGYLDNEVHLFDMETGVERRFHGHLGWIADLVFSSDGQTLATASADQTLRLWDVRQGTELRRFQGHQDQVNSLAWSPAPGSQLLASGSKDGSVRVWAPGAPSLPKSFASLPAGTFPLGLTFYPDSQRFLTASYLGGLAVAWHTWPPRQTERLDWLGRGAVRFAFLADRGLLVVGHEHGEIRVWEYETRRAITNLTLSGASVHELTLSKSGGTLTALGHLGGARRVLRLWETTRWQEIQLPNIDLANLVAASLAPDEVTLAVSCHGGTVSWWDLRAQGQQASFDWRRLGSELLIAFSPDGRFFAAAGDPGAMILVDVSTRRQRTVARAHLTRISSLAFSPDGQRLATAGTDAGDLIKIWDPATGQELATLSGVSGFYEHLGFSPDGNTLFASSDSGAALLWRALSCKEIEQGNPPDRGIGLPTKLAPAPAAPRLTLAGGVVYRETFDTHPHWVERGNVQGGGMLVTNGHAVLRSVLETPTDPARPDHSWSAYIPLSGPEDMRSWQVTFQPGRTVELRMDWLGANQDDAIAAVWVESRFNGYEVFLGRNEVILVKFGAGPDWFQSCFFWERTILPETNLTLSAAFTPAGQDLKIRVQVLDRKGQKVLWEKEVVDTAGYDPVLPDSAVKRMLMHPEGQAAPYMGIQSLAGVGLAYVNPDHPPAGPVEVTIDNFEVREYEAAGLGQPVER